MEKTALAQQRFQELVVGFPALLFGFSFSLTLSQVGFPASLFGFMRLSSFLSKGGEFLLNEGERHSRGSFD